MFFFWGGLGSKLCEFLKALFIVFLCLLSVVSTQMARQWPWCRDRPPLRHLRGSGRGPGDGFTTLGKAGGVFFFFFFLVGVLVEKMSCLVHFFV